MNTIAFFKFFFGRTFVSIVLSQVITKIFLLKIWKKHLKKLWCRYACPVFLFGSFFTDWLYFSFELRFKVRMFFSVSTSPWNEYHFRGFWGFFSGNFSRFFSSSFFRRATFYKPCVFLRTTFLVYYAEWICWIFYSLRRK